MNKEKIKKILMSMRTPENDAKVNNILGKIDLLSEEKIQLIFDQIGNDEEKIRKYLEEKINVSNDEHTPINKMFSYGIAGNCIHLHMPIDLHQMINEKGLKNTAYTINLYLINAIEKIRKMQSDGFYQFKGKDTIYMISPILIRKELKFLDSMDFETKWYKKRDLQDKKFIGEDSDAQRAVDKFGNENSVGVAKIGFDKINSEEWQEKRKNIMKKFEDKGIILE